MIPYPTAVFLLVLSAAYLASYVAWQAQIADAIDVEAVS